MLFVSLININLHLKRIQNRANVWARTQANNRVKSKGWHGKSLQYVFLLISNFQNSRTSNNNSCSQVCWIAMGFCIVWCSGSGVRADERLKSLNVKFVDGKSWNRLKSCCELRLSYSTNASDRKMKWGDYREDVTWLNTHVTNSLPVAWCLIRVCTHTHTAHTYSRCKLQHSIAKAIQLNAASFIACKIEMQWCEKAAALTNQ